jgi:16S rRNA processing protein RimM
VLVLAAGRPSLLKGHFYHHQLVGCEVVSETDEVLGTLTEILKTGANDVFVVRKPAGGELLLPAVSSVILQLEPARRLIRVRIPDGLKDG